MTVNNYARLIQKLTFQNKVLSIYKFHKKNSAQKPDWLLSGILL